MDQQFRAGAARIDKVLALLDSDNAGEAQAAARALRRLLTREALAAAPDELEACLAYAVEAITQLTRDIEGLRRDNARLRAGGAGDSAAGPAVVRWRGLAA
jgi:hypothetical protein